MPNHSLTGAVSAGIISEEAAFCGLASSDLAALAAQDPTAKVLVRFRSTSADGRMVMSAFDAFHGTHFHVGDALFLKNHVRDILASSFDSRANLPTLAGHLAKNRSGVVA